MKPQRGTVYWKQIYEKYPKAFKIFLEWIKTYDEICEYDIECLENEILCFGGGDFTKFIHFNRGDLYTFFDERKVFVDIDHEFGVDWTFTIDVDGTGRDGEDIIYHSRKEVETAAFEKAFGILDKNIKS